MKDYILKPNNVPFVLYGNSGCGKTAIIAKFTSQVFKDLLGIKMISRKNIAFILIYLNYRYLNLCRIQMTIQLFYAFWEQHRLLQILLTVTTQ
jgi:hypothetical protein